MMQIEASLPRPFMQVGLYQGITNRLLERLDVVQRSPTDLSAAAALERLSGAGLVCSQLRGPRLRIVGGLKSFVARGIQGYEYPFAIIHESDGQFAVSVAGARSFDDEDDVAPTLTDAVDIVMRAYVRRGMLALVK